MKGKYLSEIVNVEDLEIGKLNLIEAPCGCGKTTFAKNKLKDMHKEKQYNVFDELYNLDMLYLIDTAITNTDMGFAIWLDGKMVEVKSEARSIATYIFS